jgi:hypothetical protein
MSRHVTLCFHLSPRLNRIFHSIGNLTNARTFYVSGVVSLAFHPKQPWIFTGGGDGVVRLFQNIP